MGNERETAGGEWRQHWPLAGIAMMGFSFSALPTSILGLFMEPLQKEFGWTRAEVSSGLSFLALVAVPFSPVVGALVDRWGARRLAVPGTFLCACALASLSLANGSIMQWLALWVIYAIVELAIKGTVWTTAVVAVFSAGRGMALAVTLSGSALALILGPVVAQVLVDNLGWRQAFLWLGGGWGTVVFLLVILFFHDGRGNQSLPTRRPRDALVASASDLPGLSLQDALRNPAILRIGAATFLTVVIVIAVMVHLVPILTGTGLSRGEASVVAAISGIFSVLGKVLTGWLLDKGTTGWIAPISVALPAITYAALLQPELPIAITVLAAAALGYGNGAFLHLASYLTSRYCGLRSFGMISGLIASLMAIGVATGPLVAGLIFDMTGTYTHLLLAGIPTALASGLLLVGLGPYPIWDNEDREVEPEGAMIT